MHKGTNCWEVVLSKMDHYAAYYSKTSLQLNRNWKEKWACFKLTFLLIHNITFTLGKYGLKT